MNSKKDNYIENDEGYRLLATAIVQQACEDYYYALKYIKQCRNGGLQIRKLLASYIKYRNGKMKFHSFKRQVSAIINNLKDAMITVEVNERFFKSGRFNIIGNGMNGDYLMEQLQRRVEIDDDDEKMIKKNRTYKKKKKALP